MLGGLAAGAFAVKSVGSVFQAGARIGSHSQLDGFGSIFFSGLLLFFSPFFFFLSDTTTFSVNPQTLLFFPTAQRNNTTTRLVSHVRIN